MAAPDTYVAWINEHVGFNPRGQAHSDILTSAIFQDLEEACPAFGSALGSGEIGWLPNVGLTGRRHSSPLVDDDEEEIEPNIDGVVLRATTLTPDSQRSAVPLTIENKTIMTAHGKARTNRYNDARAYASHVHAASPATVAAFTIVVNTASTYRNPDAFARAAATSGVNPPTAASKTIDLFRSMRIRSDSSEPVGRCEAVLILAIEYDGENATARLVSDSPAPRPGEPFSYEWFLARICEQYSARSA